MRILLLTLLVLLPGPALAQGKALDPKTAAARNAYDTCLVSKDAAGRAKLMDHKQFQKFLEASCKTEADALYAAVVDWSKARNLKSNADKHDSIAGFYVGGVLINRVVQYAAGGRASVRKANGS